MGRHFDDEIAERLCLYPSSGTQQCHQLDYQDYTNQIILGLELTRGRKPYSINIFANGEVKGRKNNGHERQLNWISVKYIVLREKSGSRK